MDRNFTASDVARMAYILDSHPVAAVRAMSPRLVRDSRLLAKIAELDKEGLLDTSAVLSVLDGSTR